MIKAEENLGLVHACASKFKNRKEAEYEDIFSAGCIGLVKAAKKFDESLGYSFSTYAVPFILGEIRHYLRDNAEIRLGRSFKEKSVLIFKAAEDFLSVHGRKPSVKELCNETGINESEICLVLGNYPVKKERGDDENEENEISSDENIQKTVENRIIISEIFGLLDNYERKVVYFRYYNGLTQSQTAEKLKVSQVQISRTEKRIREKLAKKNLNAY